MATRHRITLFLAVSAILVSAVGCPPPKSQPLPSEKSAPGPSVTTPPAEVPETTAPSEPTTEGSATKESATEGSATKEPAAETQVPEIPTAAAPKAEEPKAEEPKMETPTAEAPKEEVPKADEAKSEKPKTETPPAEATKEEAPKTVEPKAEMKAEAPKKEAPKPEAKAEKPKNDAPKAEESAQVGKAELFLKLPEGCNTPDGMCLLDSGDVILSMPNFNNLEEGARLMKITPDNKVEKFLELGKNPDTGDLIGPLGVCQVPSGDLFLADFQMNGKKQSRVLRIPMKDGKPGEPVPAIEGFHVSNAVISRDGYLYVSETQIDIEAQPGTSGVLRFKLEDLDKGVIKLADDVAKDPHFLGVIEFHNKELRLGADGLCFDDQGNLYCGNFSDGTLHRFEFDDQGNVKSNAIFAKADFMKSCDGLFFNPKTKEVYVTDSMANAIQAVSMDGKVRTLAQNGDTDGLDGGMDQPCEVLLRGNELIVSNMDWPVPGCINQEYNEPCTLSVIRVGD